LGVPQKTVSDAADVTFYGDRECSTRECTTDVKQSYMQNGLQLNPDKSEALFMGTATQLRAPSGVISDVCISR